MMPMDGEPEDVISTESSRTASKAKLVEVRRNRIAQDTKLHSPDRVNKVATERRYLGRLEHGCGNKMEG